MVLLYPEAALSVLNSCLPQDKPMVPGTSQGTCLSMFRPSVSSHTMVLVYKGWLIISAEHSWSGLRYY